MLANQNLNLNTFLESPPLTTSMAYGTAMENKVKEHYGDNYL